MRALLVLLAALALPAVASRPQASIELLPQATVASAGVVLGDVARLHAGDLGVMRALVHLPVGRAPHPGEAAVLHRADLAQWVRRQLGIAPDALEWSGAQETRVVRTAPQLKGEDIARAAVDGARSRLRAAGQAFEVEARMLPRDLDVPEGKLRLEVRGIADGPWTRRLLVWVDVWAERGFVRTVPVSLQLSDGAEAAAGEGPLLRGDAPAPASEVERGPVAVARGEWAVLRTVEGSITLESRVEVLQDGRPGQRVRVRPQGGTAPLFARVLGPGRLEVAP